MPASLRRRLDRVLAAAFGERVQATFLVTWPADDRVRADLYAAGADFSDDRIAAFDWSFRVSARRRAWERFTERCRDQLQQLEIAAL